MSVQKRIEEMRNKLGQVGEKASDIANRVERERREYTASEQREMAALQVEADGIGQAITALQADVITATASAPQPRVTVTSPSQLGQPYGSSFSGGVLVAVTAIGRHVETVNALVNYTRTGIRNAMSIGSSPDGGYEVPIQLDQDLQVVAANYSPLLKLAKLVERATDGYRANVSTTLPASAWKAEGDARAVTASPTLAQIVPQRGAVAAVVQASTWVMQDATHDLYNFLVSELGRQFGAAIGAAIISGANAAASPKGITAQTTAATADGARAFGTLEHIPTGGAGTAPTLDNCITALSHLHPYYQQDAAWLMSPSAAAALMTEKAAGGGSYQWSPDLSASQPPTLFGKPVFIDPSLPAATTPDALSVWLGDWKRAYVVVRYGLPVLIRDDVTVKGQVLLYSEQRVGGNMTDSSALKAIKSAAA